MKVTVVLGPELLEKIQAAMYWQGVQTGALWTAVILVVAYLLCCRGPSHL